MKKHIPNILSVLRIICSLLLVSLINYRIGFTVLYFVIGLTDIFDGLIARKLNVASELGAKLDSLADLVFYIILVVIFTKYFSSIIATNHMLALIGVALIRLLNLVLTKIKYKKFVFVHTIANKISGVLLYLLPVIILFKKSYSIILLTFVFVLMAALEELLITIKSLEANLNRKSIFRK